MQNTRYILFTVLLLMLLGFPMQGSADTYDHYKLVLGMPFVHFDVEDIFHQRWVSSFLRGRPTIILTGHRYQRYEILKWAEMLKRDFGLPGTCHLLWVVNLRKFPWTTSRGTVTNQWRSFAPPIPLLLDWHGEIGKGLRVNYNVPNIIAIDALGRFAMHEMHTFTPEVYVAVASRIRALVAATPAMLGPGFVGPGMGPMLVPTGRLGDSK